jgi:hypothetical protein
MLPTADTRGDSQRIPIITAMAISADPAKSEAE